MIILGSLEARNRLRISVNWTFFARCHGRGAIRANIGWKSAISLHRRPVGAWTRGLYFHFRSKIWRHARVTRPRFLQDAQISAIRRWV